MAFFASLKVDNSKQHLKEKGYWFYVRNVNSRMMGVPIPIRSVALVVSWFIHVIFNLVFVAFVLSLFSSTVSNFVQQNVWFLVGGVLGAILLTRLALIGKIYDPRHKDYYAVNKGKRDKMYTSDESLYTTVQEGIYLCESCANPVATTDDKIDITFHTIKVRKLIDNGKGLDIRNSHIRCGVCRSEIGKLSIDGVAELDGRKLALDFGELHYIYPN